MIGHIAERFLIHLVTGPILIGIVWVALVYWYDNNRKVRWWLEDPDRVMLTMAGLVIAALVTQREAWDLYYGRQTLVKTVVDQVFWFPIAGAGCWWLYRLVKKMGGRQ
jgi:plasmid replication initiation protein